MSLIQLETSLLSTEHVNNIKEEPMLYKQEIFENEICRVCANPADIPITEKIGDTAVITAIRMVADISITEDDCYPKYVCKTCLEELKISLQFKKKCEATDMIFRKAITPLETGTSSNLLLKHGFSLLLNQIEEKGLAQKVEAKDDEIYDDFSQEDLPDSSAFYTNQDMVKTVTKKTIKPSRKIPSSVTNIEIHKDEKRKKLLKIHKCKRCDLKFDTKDDLEKHRKENSCIYRACPLCNKLVLNLTNHERIVHSRTHKYTCHQCGKIYYSSGALVNHMHKHRDTKEYYCDHCPYRGKRKSYLVCHMRVHTGERRYLCAMCPLKFTNISNLTKHQLIHSNKKFECSKCKRLFRREIQLKDHFDAAHLNIRYRCSICGRDLSSRKKLLNHELRIHKREKNKLFEEVQRVVIRNENDNDG